MTTKAWNALLAIIATIAVGAAVLVQVVRVQEGEELEKELRLARARIDEVEARAQRRLEALDPDRGASENRVQLEELRTQMAADADALTQALEEKARQRQALDAMKAELLGLEEKMAAEAATTTDETTAEDDGQRAAWRDEETRLREEIARLEAAVKTRPAVPAVKATGPVLAATLKGLLLDSRADTDPVLDLANSEPVLQALDQAILDPETRVPALRLASRLSAYDLDRLNQSAEIAVTSDVAGRKAWLDSWSTIRLRNGGDFLGCARALPRPLQLALLQRVGESTVPVPAAVELVLLLLDQEEGREALRILDEKGKRRAVLDRLARDLPEALEREILTDYVLAGLECISEVVELATTNPDLRLALDRAFPELLKLVDASGGLEERALLLTEYRLLRDRLRGEGGEAPSFPSAPDFDERLTRLEADLAATIDIESEARVLALLRPRGFRTPSSLESLRSSFVEQRTAAGLDAVLKSEAAITRREALAGLASGLVAACAEDRPAEHFAARLRLDAHEYVEPLLWRHLRDLDPEERANGAFYCLEHGRAAASQVLENLLDEDVAGRMQLLEKLFDFGPRGVAIASRVAGMEDGRAVFRLVELALERDVPLERSVIATVLRSPVIDFDRRDVYMAAFRMSLGDDFRALLYEALTDEATPRKDVLLEDLALPADQALRPVIVRFLASPDARLRESALRVLCHYPTADIIDKLAALARDEDSMVRVQLARCFARSIDEVARGILMTLTRDSSAFVREAAALGLAPHRGSRVTPILRERLNDEVPEVRIAAARSLIAQGHEDAVASLIGTLDLPVVNEFTRHHLRRRFGKDFDDREAWLAWWESDGRHRFGD